MIAEEAALIARYIAVDPHHPGPGDVRLSASAVPVWAVIGHAQATGGSVGGAAAGCGIATEEVKAALAYYRHQRSAIDVRSAGNSPANLLAPDPSGRSAELA